VGGCERVSEVAFATFTAKEKGKSRKGEFRKLLVQFCKHMTLQTCLTTAPSFVVFQWFVNQPVKKL
jgi:hypothetical protein